MAHLDKLNARKHSDRNKKAIRQSLEAVGAGRSILLDADDNVLAGNGVLEQAEALGLPLRVIETNGAELVAVKRTDLTGDKARQAATLDNIVADTSAFEYDAERLREALQNDPVSKAIAEQDERLRELLKPFNPDEIQFKEYDESVENEVKTVVCPNCGHSVPV